MSFRMCSWSVGRNPTIVTFVDSMTPELGREVQKHSLYCVHDKNTLIYWCSSIVRIFLYESNGTYWPIRALIISENVVVS